MPGKEPDTVFISFLKSDDGNVTQIRTGLTQDHCETFNDDGDKKYEFISHGTPPSDDKIEDGPEEGENSIDTICRNAMFKFDTALYPYHNLIETTRFFREGLQKVGMENQVYRETKEVGNLVNSVDKIETYTVKSAQFTKISEYISGMKEVDDGMKILPSSILLSLIATFDTIIAEFVNNFLTANPERIESSSKQISYSELFAMDDLQSVKEKIISDEVDRLLRGSHSDQVKYIEKLIDTEISSKYDRWSSFVEIFERRNLYAHNGGIANPIYISNIKDLKGSDSSAKLGEPIPLTPNYLHRSVDHLIEFGITMAFVSWRKAAKNPTDPFQAMSHATYYFITKRRFKLAIWLLEFALKKQSRKGVDDVVIRMMYINLANSFKKNKQDDYKKVIAELDWSASSLSFKTCIACLNDDIKEVCDLLPRAAAAKEISARDVREWPVFDWVRSSREFRSAYKDAFGEDLGGIEDAEPQNPVPASEQSSADGDGDGDGDDDRSTVH